MNTTRAVRIVMLVSSATQWLTPLNRAQGSAKTTFKNRQIGTKRMKQMSMAMLKRDLMIMQDRRWLGTKSTNEADDDG